jgi:4-methylaminobutanoate oxidase (formaldehyde-forming)
LSRLTAADLGNEAFPFGTAQDIDLAYATIRALRITYVGELGWELHVPTEFAMAGYDAIVAEGDGLCLRHAGFHALSSLRIEKGYRAWGHDVTSETTALEAGLGFAVAFEKPVSFIGRDALLRQRERPLRRRLVHLVLDNPEPLLYGGEPIYRDGVLVGQITSAAYGHTLGRAVGMGYVEHEEGVDRAFIETGAYEIRIAGERFAATATLQPPYDPKNSRPRM